MAKLIVKDRRLCIVNGRLVSDGDGAPCVCGGNRVGINCDNPNDLVTFDPSTRPPGQFPTFIYQNKRYSTTSIPSPLPPVEVVWSTQSCSIPCPNSPFLIPCGAVSTSGIQTCTDLFPGRFQQESPVFDDGQTGNEFSSCTFGSNTSFLATKITSLSGMNGSFPPSIGRSLKSGQANGVLVRRNPGGSSGFCAQFIGYNFVIADGLAANFGMGCYVDENDELKVGFYSILVYYRVGSGFGGDPDSEQGSNPIFRWNVGSLTGAVPFGTVVPNQVSPCNFGSGRAVAFGGTATVTFAGFTDFRLDKPDCGSGVPEFIIAEKCDDPSVRIPIDIDTNVDRKPGIRYLGEYFRLTEDSTQDNPVYFGVEWVDEVCPGPSLDYIIATKCGDSSAQISVDINDRPSPQHITVIHNGDRYAVGTQQTSDSPASVQWSTDPCPAQFRIAELCGPPLPPSSPIQLPPTVVYRVNPQVGEGNGRVVLAVSNWPNPDCSPVVNNCEALIDYRPTTQPSPGPANFRVSHILGTPCVPTGQTLFCRPCPSTPGPGALSTGDSILDAMGFDPEDELRRIRSGGCCGQPGG